MIQIAYIGQGFRKLSDLLKDLLDSTPNCDLCGHPGTEKNPLLSDGVGMSAHQGCWDKSDNVQKRRRRYEKVYNKSRRGGIYR